MVEFCNEGKAYRNGAVWNVTIRVIIVRIKIAYCTGNVWIFKSEGKQHWALLEIVTCLLKFKKFYYGFFNIINIVKTMQQEHLYY